MGHYVIVSADGDNLTELIKSKGLEDVSKSLYAFFTNLGRQQNIYDYTKSFNGELIYAGGDDILAILPLHKDLGEYIATLQGQFDRIVGTSLSVGVSIVPCVRPLHNAIKDAFNVLKKVKEKGSSLLIRYEDEECKTFDELFKNGVKDGGREK
jgi:CRISPR-associated protein Cmr2